MSVYAIAQLTITDRAIYDRYQAKFMGVMKHFRDECWRRMRIRL
jgi:uncharacterized protein (DUF1330 family)